LNEYSITQLLWILVGPLNINQSFGAAYATSVLSPFEDNHHNIIITIPSEHTLKKSLSSPQICCPGKPAGEYCDGTGDCGGSFCNCAGGDTLCAKNGYDNTQTGGGGILWHTIRETIQFIISK
jgi:hypothetical protein